MQVFPIRGKKGFVEDPHQQYGVARFETYGRQKLD